MLLTMVGIGERVRFRAVNAGRGLQSRLASMGLMPGVELEVVSNNSCGPFIIDVHGSRLMLGRGMAEKIIVH
ncbi:MAG: ferrous iron transport protein A [Deltaproteobacteria bacterium]|nr:ferrous iron transport protein A [Deltaproteobacteria bacterium]